jgi:3D (Asp-Asp-Asp) domain-containing protein
LDEEAPDSGAPIMLEEVEDIEEIEEPEPVETVTYRVTAYCACEKCCGKWALNRPLDENGEPIVYGAAGKVLVSGTSVASTLPFGTKIELDGYGTVIVEDRFAKWVVEKYGENIIDIYFDTHEETWSWGCQYIEGVIVE